MCAIGKTTNLLLRGFASRGLAGGGLLLGDFRRHFDGLGCLVKLEVLVVLLGWTSGMCGRAFGGVDGG